MLNRYTENEKLVLLRTDRRTLHRIPETRFELPKTRGYIMSVLKELKPDTLIEIEGGIKCVFRSEKPEKGAIALRADMDALEITEDTGVEWASEHEGVMHACGHDGHMASLLLTAREIANNRHLLKRDVTLIFQPAEEGCGGAKLLIDAGIMHDPEVTEVLGMHMWPECPIGTLNVRKGPEMASIALVDVEFTGSPAHGATPHKGHDALLAGSMFVESVYACIRAQTDPFEPTVFSIGKMDAGKASNIVAANAVLSGTIRAYSEESENKVLEIIRRTADVAASATGCTAEVRVPSRHDAVINDPEYTDKIIGFMGDRYREMAPVLISEDFSAYQMQVPGTFFFTGCRDEKYTSALHTSRFMFDEAALIPAEEIFIEAVFQDDREVK